MTVKAHKQREIEALGALVDRYGADRTRWPAPERLRFAALLKESAEARELLSRAAAFDRLLDEAPLVAGERQAALVDRIVSQARAASPRDAAASAVVPGSSPLSSGETAPSSGVVPEHAGTVVDLAARRSRSSAVARMRSGVSSPWPAAALLAASLVLGIFAGSNGLLPAANFGLSTASGDSDFSGRTLALGPDVGAADEDTL